MPTLSVALADASTRTRRRPQPCPRHRPRPAPARPVADRRGVVQPHRVVDHLGLFVGLSVDLFVEEGVRVGQRIAVGVDGKGGRTASG